MAVVVEIDSVELVLEPWPVSGRVFRPPSEVECPEAERGGVAVECVVPVLGIHHHPEFQCPFTQALETGIVEDDIAAS